MPKFKPLPSQERLKELYDYDAEAGEFIRKHRQGRMLAGTIAGSTNSVKGYRRVYVDDGFYYIHRLVWKYIHGVDPEEIDHLNHDVNDNRISNLSNCTHSENLWNIKPTRKNSSVCTGVSQSWRKGKWRARITVNMKEVHLGTYNSIEEAKCAYLIGKSIRDAGGHVCPDNVKDAMKEGSKVCQ